MANVKICDRCGETITATTAQTFGFGAWRYCLFDRNMSQKTYSEWDLCHDCGKKLEQFLKGAELGETITRPDNYIVNAQL